MVWSVRRCLSPGTLLRWSRINLRSWLATLKKRSLDAVIKLKNDGVDDWNRIRLRTSSGKSFMVIWHDAGWEISLLSMMGAHHLCSMMAMTVVSERSKLSRPRSAFVSILRWSDALAVNNVWRSIVWFCQRMPSRIDSDNMNYKWWQSQKMFAVQWIKRQSRSKLGAPDSAWREEVDKFRFLSWDNHQPPLLTGDVASLWLMERLYYCKRNGRETRTLVCRYKSASLMIGKFGYLICFTLDSGNTQDGLEMNKLHLSNGLQRHGGEIDIRSVWDKQFRARILLQYDRCWENKTVLQVWFELAVSVQGGQSSLLNSTIWYLEVMDTLINHLQFLVAATQAHLPQFIGCGWWGIGTNLESVWACISLTRMFTTDWCDGDSELKLCEMDRW